MARTITLVVLDGWGIGPDGTANPISQVKPPVFSSLLTDYPTGSLQASGITVGLPWGEVGNSEVGHLTMGAGKVLYQHYPKITMAIEDESFFSNPVLVDLFEHAKRHGGSLHAAGLLTSASTHASLKHIHALLSMGERMGVRVWLDLFADGVDGPPQTLRSLLARVPREAIASLTGRAYAMDRKENWTSVERAYRAITIGEGTLVSDLEPWLSAWEAKGESEEFLPPTILTPDAHLQDGDSLLFFNFREDGVRELTSAFVDPAFPHFSRPSFPELRVATMTRYLSSFTVPVAFEADAATDTLGKTLADHGLRQLRVAESYKYAHVTSFFNGYREDPYENEYRVIIPSDATPHPDLHPELRAHDITDRVVAAIGERSYDFILVNYSNPDTIAHTGNYEASLQAVRVIDAELGRLVEANRAAEGILIITGDHGNIEELMNPQTGEVETQHDDNPVPFILVGSEWKGKHFGNQEHLRNETSGILADVAPTILALLGIPQPPEMTGRSLLGEIR